MASKGYVDTKAGTAVVLRLAKPWHGGSGCVVNGDSAFASVTTAVAKVAFHRSCEQQCSLRSTLINRNTSMMAVVRHIQLVLVVTH